MSTVPTTHYVRLKRHNLTIFIHCDIHSDTVQAIKERYAKLTGQTFHNVRLHLGQQNLEDFCTLYNCGIELEGVELIVLHAKGVKDDSTGDRIWETMEEALNPPAETLTEMMGTEVGNNVTSVRDCGELTIEGCDFAAQMRAEDRANRTPDQSVGFVGV
ncbi:hypothetical protein TRVL_02850 [Trypanosoma vivax]|nr:hypothetical protein TRVL_02850 [Trypanosoma vivax]